MEAKARRRTRPEQRPHDANSHPEQYAEFLDYLERPRPELPTGAAEEARRRERRPAPGDTSPRST